MNDDNFDWLRKLAKNKKSEKIISEIERDKKMVEKEGKIIKSDKKISIKVGNFIIWLRKDGASSAIDMYFEIFQKKHYTTLPEFSGRNDKIILDIGANEGYYVLKMKENNPRLKIFAVEPNPIAFKILRKNIESNGLKDVIPINKAVSLKKGRIAFQIVDEISTIGSVKISLENKPWLEKSRIREIRVPSVTLSGLFRERGIKSVDIMKMNIEGSEADMLKSGIGCLKMIRRIVLEYHSTALRNECVNLLERNGFRLVHEIGGKRGHLYFVQNAWRI